LGRSQCSTTARKPGVLYKSFKTLWMQVSVYGRLFSLMASLVTLSLARRRWTKMATGMRSSRQVHPRPDHTAIGKNCHILAGSSRRDEEANAMAIVVLESYQNYQSPYLQTWNRFPVRQPYFSYRPVRLHRLAKSILRNRFLGSINVAKSGLREAPLFIYCHFGPQGIKS
jgi:hypothetical protein